jgi:hypothetical protein
MKWIVMYVIIQTYLVPCPTPEPTYDEFGIRTNESMNVLSVACYDTRKTNKEKKFDSLEEAQEFVKKGKEKYTNERPFYIPGSVEIEGWKIIEKKEVLP